jgi:hypothetical protein
MEKERDIACTIIDLVENAIRANHRTIEKFASKRKGNTLLYGEAYYLLEDQIVEYLKEQLKIPISFNPSRRGEHICDDCFLRKKYRMVKKENRRLKKENELAMYDA